MKLLAALSLLPVLAWSASLPQSERQLLGLPAGAPLPNIPADNPLTREKIILGRYLFYEKRMSANGEYSCASCHRQALAFTDGLPAAKGATGATHPRGSMTLVDVAWNSAFNWGDNSVHSLEEQALKPMMSTQPVELGYATVESQFLRLIETDSLYRRLFLEAFPGDSHPWSTGNIAKALATFERTIISRQSPWDRFHLEGDENAISESAKRGELLFFSPLLGCFRCHSGPSFSDAAVPGRAAAFHNTGLYNLPGAISYPEGGRGIFESSQRPEDVGKFKTPTLRNIAMTAPYMHDGSIATLEEALDHYAAGGRAKDNPNKDSLLHGFPLPRQYRIDLVEFLKSLTDVNLLNREDLSDPWANQTTPGQLEPTSLEQRKRR